MKSAHHQLPHVFPITLWGFPSLEGNNSKLGLDLDNIILLIPKKSAKLLRLVFSFVFGCIELEIFQ
jgi:hypothetical protein